MVGSARQAGGEVAGVVAVAIELSAQIIGVWVGLAEAEGVGANLLEITDLIEVGIGPVRGFVVGAEPVQLVEVAHAIGVVVAGDGRIGVGV